MALATSATAPSSAAAPANEIGSNWGYPVQETGQRLRDAGGDSETDRRTDGRKCQRATHGHPEDLSAQRAERHADSNLAPPLCHRVGRQTIDADHRQQQRDRSDTARDPYGDTLGQ